MGVEIEKRTHKLKNNVTSKWSKQFWPRFSKGIASFFSDRQSEQVQKFVNARYIYHTAFIETGLDKEIDIPVDEAIELIAEAHAEVNALPGSKELINNLHDYYPTIALTSDADNDFLNQAVKRNNFSFDIVLSSESVKGYKVDRNGGVFKRLLELSNMRASEILHIGDSIFDITGSQKYGFTTWIFNPTGKKVSIQTSCRVVDSLEEIRTLLLP